MAILSLVFATFFCRTGALVGPFGDSANYNDYWLKLVLSLCEKLKCEIKIILVKAIAFIL